MAQQLNAEIIQAAIDGLTARQQAIGHQIDELRAMLPGGSSKANATPKREQSARRGGKRQLSAEARERIAEAQRRRWAAARGESKAAAPARSTAPKKRRLSPAGRKAIQDALRRRWASKRSEGTVAKSASAVKSAKRGRAKTAAPAVDSTTA